MLVPFEPLLVTPFPSVDLPSLGLLIGAYRGFGKSGPGRGVKRATNEVGKSSAFRRTGAARRNHIDRACIDDSPAVKNFNELATRERSTDMPVSAIEDPKACQGAFKELVRVVRG